MVVLTSSYILLIALVQNVFYIHSPHNVYNASIMLEASDFSTGSSWTMMSYHFIHDRSTPVFSIHVPPSTSNYLRFKVRLQFRNQTFGETEWRTLISDCKNTTQCNLPIADSNNSNTYFNLVVFIAVTCSILLSKLMYKIARSQCIVWFNK